MCTRRVESYVPHAVGSVPYLNARPLVHRLPPDVAVTYHVPSQLPSLLHSGAANAVLVSSIEAISNVGMRVCADASISTRGEVMSVRLFSKVPFAEVRSVALDRSSMTSNALARIVLRERFETDPVYAAEPPDLQAMLQRHDAALLIGDNGMRAKAGGLHVLDLGSEWASLTGLPFVWALWVGFDGLTEDLAADLVRARAAGVAAIPEIIGEEVRSGRWHPAVCSKYLAEVMNYDLDENHLAGLRLFGRKLIQHGLLAAAYEPELVRPRIAV